MIVVIVSMVDWEFSGCISNGKKIQHRLYVALPTWICYFHTCFTHDRRFATTLPIHATDHYIASEYIWSSPVKYCKYSSTAPPELWHHRLALVDCTVVVIPPLLANNTTNNKNTDLCAGPSGGLREESKKLLWSWEGVLNVNSVFGETGFLAMYIWWGSTAGSSIDLEY